MDSLPNVALLIAGILGGAVGLLFLFVVGRRLLNLLLMRLMSKRVQRAQELLRQHQQQEFASLDRLLFQLGELHDLPAVETALRKVLDQSGKSSYQPHFIKIYGSLGIIDLYIKQLRNAPKWSDRATAAHSLGQLGVARAIPVLMASMRDPHEDTRTVKLAAAKALGQMAAAEAVPLLVAELGTLDEWASPRIAEILVAFGATAVPPLIETLASEENTNARVWAAQILGRIGASAAENHLITLLKDRYESVRLSAAEALGRLKSRQAVNSLVQVAMKDPVAPVRAEAAQALGTIGDKDVLDNLVMLLSDPDYWSRLRAIEAIELIAPEDPAVLETALRDPSPEIRRRAAVALERIGFLNRSINEIASPDRIKQRTAHRVLVEMGRAGLVESILAYLDHENFRVRSRIVDVLAEVGDDRATASIQAHISDPMWPVRARAIEAIARLNPSGGLEMILPGLSDGEETVREVAIRAVKILGISVEDSATESVIQHFDNPNAEIRASVVEALSRIKSPRVEQMLGQAMQDPNPEVRLRAVKVVSARATPAWLEPLVGCLASPSIEIRVAAVEGLGQIGTRAALEAIVKSLTTPDREFREALTSLLATYGVKNTQELATIPQTKETTLALVWTLGKTRDPAALQDLTPLVRDPDADIRAAVAGALGKIPHAEGELLLVKMLADRSERVRAAAVNSLGIIGSPQAVPKLILMLKDPDAFVRQRVVLAFGRIGGEAGLSGLDFARLSSGDDTFKAYITAGYTLCGGEIAFKTAIEQLADPATQRRVEQLMQREPAEVRQIMQENLHLEQKQEKTPALTSPALRDNYARTLRTHQDPKARISAIEALRSLGIETFRELLLDAVATDPSPEVRKLSLSVLSTEIEDDRVSTAFEQALRDPSLEVKVEAAAGLGKTGQSKYNHALLWCLAADDPQLNETSIAGLTAINRDNITLFMDELMGYSESHILRGGAQVIGEIGDPRASGLLKSWLGSRDMKLRAVTAQALGLIGTIEAKEALISILGDTSEQVRLSATRALGKMPGSDTLAALSQMCRDPSLKIRMELSRIVGTSRTVGIVDLAETLSSDPEESVRVEALLSLLLLRDLEASQRFLQIFAEQPMTVQRSLCEIPHSHPVLGVLRETASSDSRPAMRVASLQALRRLDQRPLELLYTSFDDPAPEVRAAAVEAAAELRDEPAIAEEFERLLRDVDKRVRDAVRRVRMTIIGTGRSR